MTKQALRTILKADEACVGRAEPSAQLLVDKGYTPNDDYALLAMRDVVYKRTFLTVSPQISVQRSSSSQSPSIPSGTRRRS